MPHSQSAGSWTAARRDRAAILTALAGVTVLAWLYLIRAAGAMDAAGPMDMVRVRAWGLSDFFFIFLMWAIMMVGMMVPTAIPMTLVYGAVVRKAWSHPLSCSLRDTWPFGPYSVWVRRWPSGGSIAPRYSHR